MIQLPNSIELKTLKSFNQNNGLTIYSPYINPNSSNNPNRTQLKNLLKDARQMLAARNLNPPEIDKLLQPADRLLDSDEFQSKQNNKHSLALFIGPDFFQYYRLPAEGLLPSLTISQEFRLEPIIKLIDNNKSYLVLMLSHNGAHILKGDHYNIEQIADFPTHMKEDLRIDEYPRERQPHMIAPTSVGKGSERFHQQYDQTQVDKMMLKKFFRHINSKLQKIIKGQKLPLILAGVDYLLPIYNEVNTYPYLLAEEIKGNLEHTPLNLIKNRAYTMLAAMI